MIQKTFSRSQKAENVIKSKILDTIKERTHVNILYLCGENANELHENLFSNCRLRLFFNRIMNKKLIFGIAMMLCCTNLSAQNTAPVTNIRGAQYPQITTDHRGVFQLRAPQAQEVIVDIGGKKYPMSKNAEGIWTATTDPLMSGINYYFMYVDGVQISDPASETFYGCSRMASCIEVPYNNDNRFEPADVAHGETAMRRYYSKTHQTWRRMFVYLPPSYQKQSSRQYPVLYILHGGGEDERGWALQGRTDIILENLIAQGKAEEFIVVMPDANCRDFEKELLQECIPVVEQNYRVLADADHRAMAGLSMGGLYTLNTTINHPELFRYVGVFSSGWWANTPKGMENTMGAEQYYQKLAARPNYYNQQFREFYITMGGQEDIAFNNCRIMRERFDKIGIKHTYFETPGGHTWPVWRESLYQFAQRLFKDKVELANGDKAKDYYTKPTSATSSVDDQGFIRRWRLLEPISRPVRSNNVFTDTYLREAFNTQYFKNQMTILPKDGQKVKTTVVQEVVPPGFGRGPMAQQPQKPEFKTVNETLTWHVLESSRYNVKLFRFGEEYKQRLYGVLYWAVTVIDCPEDMTVRLAVGSNSSSMWWVNGKEALLMSGDRRMVVDDCSSPLLTLKKGQNIIRGAIINGPGMSDFCIRLLDEKGKPVKNITIR